VVTPPSVEPEGSTGVAGDETGDLGWATRGTFGWLAGATVEESFPVVALERPDVVALVPDEARGDAANEDASGGREDEA
jgi:hypothetical protein